MSETKHEPQYFATVDEMHAIPEDRIDIFCEDLRIWLRTHRSIDKVLAELPTEMAEAIYLRSPRDRFGWIDDGEHNMSIKFSVVDEREKPKDVPA